MEVAAYISRKYSLSELLIILILIVGSLCPGSESRVSLSLKESKNIVEQLLLLSDYDGDVRPTGINGTEPTIVSVNIFFRSINNIDTTKMHLKTQLTFRMQWKDERLKFAPMLNEMKQSDSSRKPKVTFGRTFDFGDSNPQQPQKENEETENDSDELILPKSYSDRIWKPDLFFTNGLEIEYPPGISFNRNEYFKIFSNGEVLQSTVITVTLSCPMNLNKAPFDEQICSIRMASYAFTAEDIIFRWKSVDPVQVPSQFHHPNFILKDFKTNDCGSHTNVGIYSCLKVDLYFLRESSVYLYNFYYPMITIVIIAWFTFWLHPVKSGVPRCIILAAVLGSSQKGFISSVGTSFDLWNWGCYLFIFVSIIEFAIVSFWIFYTETSSQNNSSESFGGEEETLELNTMLNATDDQQTNKRSIAKNKVKVNSNRTDWPLRLDLLARIIYPCAFIIFLVIYYASIS